MNNSTDEDESVSKLTTGIRADLIIALCALLISSLATGASWWQARVLQAQTQVLQEQLGAQVWPYVDVSLGYDNGVLNVNVTNEGLGPAVLRSASSTVDDIPRSNFIDVLHAMLGNDLIKRKPRGEKIGLSLSSASPGSVLRPGDSINVFSLRSKYFAPRFLKENGRIRFRTCYCAIIPGKCWMSDSGSSADPMPTRGCTESQHDLLHAPVASELLDNRF